MTSQKRIPGTNHCHCPGYLSGTLLGTPLIQLANHSSNFIELLSWNSKLAISTQCVFSADAEISSLHSWSFREKKLEEV